jgi:2-beta-glucuronyltransferase
MNQQNIPVYPTDNMALAADLAPFLFISGHDYRSKRQANVHFITRELAKLGTTRFFSIGFSPLSLMKKDPRSSLWSRANHIESFNGVDCYLWRSVLHPVSLGKLRLSALERPTFTTYTKLVPPTLKRWIADSRTIILESGMSIAVFALIKQMNPRAKVIYLCSDALDTIGCSGYLQDELNRIARFFDGIRVPSLSLVTEFPDGCNIHYVPHGLDPTFVGLSQTSPYLEGTNLVSVGSMLFDSKFFMIAAEALPHLTFYVIGGGRDAAQLRLPNIRVLDEMAFKDTIAYITHADAGIAPYQGSKVSPYLADTSMKLMQFGAFGIPAICPHAAVGSRVGRFGYEPDNQSSIIAAISAALACGKFTGILPLSWQDVTQRILEPYKYQDTKINHN